MRALALNDLVLVLMLAVADLPGKAAEAPLADRPVSRYESRQRGLRLERLLQKRAALTLLQSVDFSHADLRGRKLLRRNLEEQLAEASFDEAYSSAAYQQGKAIFTVNLGGVRMPGVRAEQVDLHGAYLGRANLRGGRLATANLEHCVLNEANLVGIDLAGAHLRGARMFGADLSGAKLPGADMRQVNLRAADLRCADLSCVDLRGADLVGADLRGADLRGADLRGADLRGTRLSGARLGGSILKGDQRGAGGS